MRTIHHFRFRADYARDMPIIGSKLASGYRMPRGMDTYVFAAMLLRKAGYAVAESQLNEETVLMVRSLALELDRAGGYDSGGGYVYFYDDFDIRVRLSTSEVAIKAVDAVMPKTKEYALKVLVGMKPGLRLQQGELTRLKPVARAAVRRELLVLASSILREFERRGRFVDTDFVIDLNGVRRPAS